MVSGYRNEEGLPKQSIPTAALAMAGGVADGGPNDPSNTSSAYRAMKPYWDLVDDFDGGVSAMSKAAEKYLPKFKKEKPEDYQDRLNVARFTNIFGDIVESLAAKPFAEELKLENGAADLWVALAKDIDGRGNSIHSFGAQTFYDGLRRSIDWILVDFVKATPVPGRPLSQAEEAAQGLRPYWVHIPACSMLHVESAFVGGEEIITHARFREDAIVRDRFAESVKRRIRVFDREQVGTGPNSYYAPATWALFEEVEAVPGGKKEWIVIDSGAVTIDIIPLVPFAVGRRKGSSWEFSPPLRGAAELQVQHYRAENGLVWISANTAYPMLSANGVAPQMEGGKVKPIEIGPRSVLYAPVQGDNGRPGSWAFIEPAGESLTFLSGEVDKIEKRMRELGRNPLTVDSGNLTVVTTAFAAQKGNSAVQAWALALQFAIERALKVTALWLGEAKSPAVTVFTDFAIDLDDKGPDALLTMRKSGPGSTPDLSQETLWEEMRRRNILSADFEADKERQRILDETNHLADESDTLAAIGLGPKPTPAPPGSPSGGPGKAAGGPPAPKTASASPKPAKPAPAPAKSKAA